MIIAGLAVAVVLNAEREKLPRGAHGFASDALCDWQVAVARRGYREAELVKSIYGWSVRAASGLENFALLASCRASQVDGSFEDAVRWARAWAAQDPARRWVTCSRADDGAAVEMLDGFPVYCGRVAS